MLKRFLGSVAVSSGAIVGGALLYTREAQDTDIIHESSLLGKYAKTVKASYAGESSITIPAYEARAIILADKDNLDIAAGFARAFFRTGKLLFMVYIH
jgi:hypothetical protein